MVLCPKLSESFDIKFPMRRLFLPCLSNYTGGILLLDIMFTLTDLHGKLYL